MVEDKKVLLEKVDTVKNVADSWKKSISIEKFSWCRESMGIDALNLWLYDYMTHCYAKETTSGRMLGICYILCIYNGGEVRMSALQLGDPKGTFERNGH